MILIFCDANKEIPTHLSWVYMWFEVCSQLKINLEKSELVLVKIFPNLVELDEVLGRVDLFTTSHLLKTPCGYFLHI